MDCTGRYWAVVFDGLWWSKIILVHLSSYKVIEGRLRSISGLFSSFIVMCRMDGKRWLSYVIGLLRPPSVFITVFGWLNNDCPTKRSSTIILDAKMADFALFLHPGVLFVGPREEHLMMVLFSSYRWYPKYWVVPETSGLPEISVNTRCFGLPATRWFPKLNRVGSGIERNTG